MGGGESDADLFFWSPVLAFPLVTGTLTAISEAILPC